MSNPLLTGGNATYWDRAGSSQAHFETLQTLTYSNLLSSYDHLSELVKACPNDEIEFYNHLFDRLGAILDELSARQVVNYAE